ncbi:hypothetical protein [Streptomyces geranii]|uniref:hypothetical protein n=1 Tax=Streptomyces geranii TaxID=2058923 RepID=UPI000D030D95|nr:hypothetical protein [Streptomyces geranii]
MSPFPAWKTLLPGDGSSARILAVDFDATGRLEARFSDLARNLKTDHALWEAVPPPLTDGVVPTGAGYVEHWARRIEEERVEVRALFGYCAGAVYAGALAERLRGRQESEPLLVLFDPELSVAQTLLWQFYKVVGLMAGQLTETELAAARHAGRLAHERHDSVAGIQAELVALVRETGGPALAKAGLDASRRAELFDVFESFLRFLALAGELSPLEQWRSAVAFGSTSPMSGLRGMRAAGQDVEVAREIEVDVEHGGLLADPGLAATVSDLLVG